jgi:hypothetical protein
MGKFDWKVVSVGGVIASLTLAACGSSASLKSAISSVGASQYLEVHVSATYAGPNSQKVESILSGISYDVSYASTSGQPISQSVGHTDEEVVINVGGQPVLTARTIGTDIYLEVNPQALSSIPDLGVSSQTLAAIDLIFANRWFEVPFSLITSLAKSEAKVPSTTQVSKERAIAGELIDALTAQIEGTTYTTLPGGGFSQTGTLASIVQALLPGVEKLEGKTLPVHKVPGTYKISVTMSGSTATGGSLEVTAPDGNSGNATVGLDVTVAHNSVSIIAPTGATMVTPSLIAQLEGEALPSA